MFSVQSTPALAGDEQLINFKVISYDATEGIAITFRIISYDAAERVAIHFKIVSSYDQIN